MSLDVPGLRRVVVFLVLALIPLWAWVTPDTAAPLLSSTVCAVDVAEDEPAEDGRDAMTTAEAEDDANDGDDLAAAEKAVLPAAVLHRHVNEPRAIARVVAAAERAPKRFDPESQTPPPRG